MNNDNIVPIRSVPGIKRDGTMFEGDAYVDGQWVRFQRGLPRKIGGYRAITQTLVGPIQAVSLHSSNGVNRIFVGSSNALEYTDVDSSGIGGGVGNLTPAAFVPSDDNLWKFDELFDGGAPQKAVLLAHAAPNLQAIDSTTDRKTWYGDVSGTAALVDTTAPQVSGGCFCAAPYAFVYGDDGYIAWSVENIPIDWVAAGSGDARVTKSKIVHAEAVRGGAGIAPAFLLWSLDAVIRGTFSGGAAIFNFDTLTAASSILSSQCVVEYDGQYYWIGTDRFLMYNGVVQEVPNNQNTNFFFDNLNYNQRQLVWGTKIPRFGEIWWHYPTGDSEICDHVIIYNVRENCWYDTSLSRCAGYFTQVFRWPVMADTALSENTYVRPLGGTAATSNGGTAANAFDGDLTTWCTQVATNGNISYDFGDGCHKTITKVGINSHGSNTYDLIFEYSNDTGATVTNWTTAYDAPIATVYADGVDVFYTLVTPITARAWRVREQNGGTLDLREVYFEAMGSIIHQHEFGYDRVIGPTVLAIESYFETADVAYMAGGAAGAGSWQGTDRWIECERVELDMVQVGEMTATLIGRKYARSVETTNDYTFLPTTEKIDIKEQRRQMRWRFTSNTAGGHYEFGLTVMKIGVGDARQ